MKKAGCANKLGKSFKSIDQFPETVKFSIHGEPPEFKTKVGAFFSLLMIIGVLTFGGFRMKKMIQRDDAEVKI